MKFGFKTIDQVKKLKGLRVILRLSVNVPVEEGRITNDYRLRQVMPTLEYLSRGGARTVIVSHSGSDGTDSLRHVVKYLSKHFEVGFLPGNDLTRASEMVAHLKEGSFLVLDNVRRFEGEEKNDPKFARELAALGDIYVNEDFPVSHRKHASVVRVPKLLPSYAGLWFKKEVEELSRVFKPKRPFLVILGGAKIATKLPLIKKLLPVSDTVYVGGALANSFFKEMGYEVGKSLVDNARLGLTKLLKSSKIMIPKDVVVDGPRGKRNETPVEVRKREKILDIGSESVAELLPVIKKAGMILWNGPMGNFEAGFSEATVALARAVSESEAISLVGGGDTVSAIEKLNAHDTFTFVSTGGGAMLEFLARGTLPGIEAIARKAKR